MYRVYRLLELEESFKIGNQWKIENAELKKVVTVFSQDTVETIKSRFNSVGPSNIDGFLRYNKVEVNEVFPTLEEALQYIKMCRLLEL